MWVCSSSFDRWECPDGSGPSGGGDGAVPFQSPKRRSTWSRICGQSMLPATATMVPDGAKWRAWYAFTSASVTDSTPSTVPRWSLQSGVG